MDMNDKIIRMRETMQITTLKRSTIAKLLKNGTFPAPIKLLGRIHAWKEKDIFDWIESQNTAGK